MCIYEIVVKQYCTSHRPIVNQSSQHYTYKKAKWLAKSPWNQISLT